MARHAPARPGNERRSVKLSHIVVLVLLNSGGFKGVRFLNTLYALELGASPFAVGVLLAMYALFPLLFAVYVGKLADVNSEEQREERVHGEQHADRKRARAELERVERVEKAHALEAAGVEQHEDHDVRKLHRTSFVSWPRGSVARHAGRCIARCKTGMTGR